MPFEPSGHRQTPKTTLAALASLPREDVLALVERAFGGSVTVTFSGKADASRVARKVRPRVMRQVKRLSSGSPQAQADNSLIEGDNLQAMATMYRERGQVDLIVTDPPYNTGNDFRYNDRWETDPNDDGIGELVSAEGGTLEIATNESDQQVIKSRSALADQTSASQVRDARRDLETTTALGAIGHEAARTEVDQAIAHADITAKKEVYLPVRTELSTRQARLDADKATLAQKKREKAFFRQKYGWIVVAVVVLIVVANIVCDVPSQSGYPLLSWVNQLWDAIYMPIRNGVEHTIQQFQ